MAETDAPVDQDEIVEIQHPDVANTGRVARSAVPAWEELGWTEVTAQAAAASAPSTTTTTTTTKGK